MKHHRAIILATCLLLLGTFLLVRSSVPNLEPPPPCETPVTLPDMVQARDGYTLTLRPIYADANRVLLDAHVALPPGSSRVFVVGPEDVHLTNTDGQELPWFKRFTDMRIDITDNRIGFRGKFDPLHFSLSFDAAAHPLPTTLELHLELHVSGAAGDSKAPHFRAGPYQFDVTMPTEQGVRAAYIQQTLESPNTSKSSFQQAPSQKVRMMLEGVVVTCSETQFFLRSATPGMLLTDLFSRSPLDLTVGDWSVESLDPRPE